MTIVMLVASQTLAKTETGCVQKEDASLIFDPDELPICPPSMLELVPSTVGRPADFSAIELAGCAGLWDAALVLEPKIAAEPGFVDPEVFFELAKARRERPPLAELVEIRREERRRSIAFLQEPDWKYSDAIPHSFSYCNGVYYRASGE